MVYTLDMRDVVSHYRDKSLQETTFFSIGKEEGTLDLHSVEPKDEGIWTCRVDFKSGPTRFSQASLRVNSYPKKPVILDNRGRVVKRRLGPYKLGQTLVVTCSVLGGRPTPSVTWYMDREIVDTSFQKEESRVVNTLTIDNLKREHLDTILTCQAVNSNDSIHKITSVKLDLTFLPSQVVIQGAEKSLSAGVAHRLECHAKGGRPEPTLQWWLGHHPLVDSKQTGEVSVLEITPGPSENGKPIRCTARVPKLGRASSKEASVNLNVTFLTSVEVVAPKWTVTEGEDVVLTCQAKANPPPREVQWYKNNQTFGLPSRDFTLQLKAVDRQVSGNFSCKASNQEGSKSSLTKPLVVSFPPVCRDQPRSLRVSLHQQVAVGCRVLAVPSSNVSFKWDFKAVEEDAVVEILGNQTKMSNLSSELKYMPRSTNDFGTLLCWADNGVGQMSKPCTIDLLPFSPPSPPHNCTLLRPGKGKCQYSITIFSQVQAFPAKLEKMEVESRCSISWQPIRLVFLWPTSPPRSLSLP